MLRPQSQLGAREYAIVRYSVLLFGPRRVHGLQGAGSSRQCVLSAPRCGVGTQTRGCEPHRGRLCNQTVQLQREIPTRRHRHGGIARAWPSRLTPRLLYMCDSPAWMYIFWTESSALCYAELMNGPVGLFELICLVL